MTDNDKVPELTNGEFDKFIAEGIVLVDFFADWCMPCMMMAPVIDDLSEKFKGKIKIGKVDVAEEQGIATKFNVSSIPAFKIFKDGKLVEEFVGAVSAEELEEKLNNYL
jgi:thioredoxin 1